MPHPGASHNPEVSDLSALDRFNASAKSIIEIYRLINLRNPLVKKSAKICGIYLFGFRFRQSAYFVLIAYIELTLNNIFPFVNCKTIA